MKKEYFFAGTLITLTLCLAGCREKTAEDVESKNPVQESVMEEVITSELEVNETDEMAPEGTLAQHFVMAEQEILAEDFLTEVTDASEFALGLRNQQLIFSKKEMVEMLKQAVGEQAVSDTTVNMDEVFQTKWAYDESHFWEEKNVCMEKLEDTLWMVTEGIYSLEVVAADCHGNASVAKVYAMINKTPMFADEHTKPQVSKGIQRGKAEEAFRLVNEQRSAAGLQPLVWDDSIYETAVLRAEEILTYYSHTRTATGRTTVEDFAMGENLNRLWGDTSAAAAVQSWMNSPTHKENLLRDYYTKTAVACYETEKYCYYVQLFTY